MKEDIYLYVLGGGQEIGASCYCVEFGENIILIDCGKGLKNGVMYNPDFTPLYSRGKSPKDIKNVFITHSHFDHIGYIQDLLEQCGKVPIFTSRLTKELAKVLLLDNFNLKHLNNTVKFESYIQSLDSAFLTMNMVEYNKTMDFGTYKITFYEAGHIPGAAMIYLETKTRSILFTGDFSLDRTSLTNGAILPNNFKADTIVIDGTYAKRPKYNFRTIEQSVYTLRDILYKPISIRVNQLTKGIEIINLINYYIEQEIIPYTKIYLDDNIYNVAQAFMNSGIQVLQENCYRISEKNINHYEKAIYITMQGLHSNIKEITIDYSLHAGFDDLNFFIDKYARKNVVIVHSPNPSEEKYYYSLEDKCNQNLNFIYPENRDIYQL